MAEKESDPQTIVPQANATAPASPKFAPLLGEEQIKRDAEHKRLVEEERKRLDLVAPKKSESETKDKKESSAPDSAEFIENNNVMGFLGPWVDEAVKAGQRAIKFLEAHPAKEKPKEENIIDPNAPKDKRITRGDMERLAKMSAVDARKDPQWEQMRNFTDLNGDGNITRQEVETSYNMGNRSPTQAVIRGEENIRIDVMPADFDSAVLANNLQIPNRPAGRGPKNR